MGATDYGFDVLCVWHPFRVASFLGPVPGVSRGMAAPRSTPGYSLASLQLTQEIDMLAETGILACRGLFRGNACHYLALTFRSRNGQRPHTADECGSVGN
jgi:hypothetical protein